MPKTQTKYDIKLLMSITERDKCEINCDIYKHITRRDTKVDFKCKCGKDGRKTFRCLYEKGGGFCVDCTKENIKNKSKQTWFIKYGVENPFQAEEVKEKIKITSLQRYGVEHPFQAEEVKTKFKQTCLDKYGVEHPFQVEEVKEKNKTNLY